MLLKDPMNFLHGWWWERSHCGGSSLLMLVPSLEAEGSVAKARCAELLGFSESSRGSLATNTNAPCQGRLAWWDMLC